MAATTGTAFLAMTASTSSPALSASSTFRATPQAGILEGGNPSQYDPKNPIILFIIQASVIIIFCRLLHYPLSLLRQPRVIAEVIGGILLGPSVMGHVPGFTNAIFPAASIPGLNLVANLGLILFLFLVGVEVDLRYFISNWRVAVSVSAAGMVLPFGIGCAIAWGLYTHFQNEPDTIPITFGTYMLFIGVAMAITAFPVLCRILTELKLLRTPVGVIVLSAGVGNDVVGWILLALCVALVNAGSGLTALWVLLTCVGFALFLYFAVRPIFLWLLRRSGALQDGPSQGIVTLTLLIALCSSFLTGVIGVHPIFGAFMAGLMCPHEGGFAIRLHEVLEDLVSAIFLPLYFALSGLSTNLGLLNNGSTWGFVVAIIAVAFCAKFAGGTLAAKANGLLWRESCAVGVLMSCKGLVELIVLNIGLQARILSTRTFTMFVVMALVTTFITTPLTAWLYPPWYQRKLELWRKGEVDLDDMSQTDRPLTQGPSLVPKQQSQEIRRLVVYIRLDTMPALLSLISLLGGRLGYSRNQNHPHLAEASTTDGVPSGDQQVEVHGVRLVQLTERLSAVMKVSEVDEYSHHDPILNSFRMLGQLYNMAISGEVSIVPEASYAETLIARSSPKTSDMLILPWSETGSMSDAQTIPSENVRDRLSNGPYSSFVRQTLASAECHVAIFVNEGFVGNTRSGLQRKRSVGAISIHDPRKNPTLPMRGKRRHIFLPYFGNDDGRLALRCLLQMAENVEVTATVVHYEFQTSACKETSSKYVVDEETARYQGTQEKTTVNAAAVSLPDQDETSFLATLRHSLPIDLQQRVVFESCVSATPIADAAVKAQQEMTNDSKNWGDMIIVGRRLDFSMCREQDEISTCLGQVAKRLLETGVSASLLVTQAATNSNWSAK